MLRKGRSFDATFIQLDIIDINSFVETDTKDGSDSIRCAPCLDSDDSLIAILYDTVSGSILRHVPVAKAIRFRRSNPDLVYKRLKRKEEAAG